MKTFENLIPKLHKKQYVKEDHANQTISYDIETFNQKIYVAKKPTKHNIHHHKH